MISNGYRYNDEDNFDKFLEIHFENSNDDDDDDDNIDNDGMTMMNVLLFYGLYSIEWIEISKLRLMNY